MKTSTSRIAATIAFALATCGAGSAWAWDKYYWTGTASADFNSAANWTTNHVDAAAAAPEWRSGKDLYFETADIVSYRVEFGKNSYNRGGWYINTGTEAQPLEFYCAKGSTIVSPDSSQYNYASSLTIASTCDSWVWINGGQWDEFASDVNIGNSDFAGHLRIGNDRNVDTLFETLTNKNFTVNQGAVVASNATLRLDGKLTVGNIEDKAASFGMYNSTMVVRDYFTVKNSATFDLCGGSVTNANYYLSVDNSGTMTIRNNGRYSCQAQLIVGNYGAGTLNIIDGGEASSGTRLAVGYRSGSSATVNIANGGILTVPYVWLGNNGASATVALDGGTIRAAKDERLIRAANNLNVTVGANGGAIDAAGYNVTIEEDLDNAAGATGAMTFKGGGKVTLAVQPTYTGTTTIELGTALVVPAALDWSKVVLAIPAAGLAKGSYEVLRLSGGGTLPDDLLAQVALPSDASASFQFSADKTALFCAYGVAPANCVAKWDFNNYDSSNPSSANVLHATIGGDAKPCYYKGKGSEVTADLGEMRVVTTGLEEGNYAIAIPTNSHVALPIPDAVKNHAWTIKMRFYAVNADVYRCFFNRDNTTDGDLFIRKSNNTLGGGRFAGTGNYTKSVSNGAWHTLTVSSSESRYEIVLDESVPLAISKDSGERFNYFADPSEALTDIGGVGHLLLCADENGEDDEMYIDYVELYDGLLDDFPAGAKRWTGFAGSGSMRDPDNWFGGVTPVAGDVLDFSTIAQSTALAADFGDDRVFQTARFGAGIVTLTGSLYLNSLTNADTLAVASTGSLTVTGDLVATVDVAGGSQAFLHSNEGTVVVRGKAIGYQNVGRGNDDTGVHQYVSVSDGTRPIIANGIAYNCGGAGQLNMHLTSIGNQPGMWAVGAGGFTFTSSRKADYTKFFTGDAAATIYSSDDWTLANSGKQNSRLGDMCVPTGSLTIETSDYSDPATPRTVTLKGRIFARAPVTIKGCGTVVVNTTGSYSGSDMVEDLKHTCLTNAATLFVTNTATLKINDGKKITGNGTVSLAAGTALVLPSATVRANTPCIPGLALPETGTATLRVDGSRLRFGEYTLLDSVPANYANLIVDRDSTAICGRKAWVFEKDGKLVLNVESDGLVVIFK